MKLLFKHRLFFVLALLFTAILLPAQTQLRSDADEAYNKGDFELAQKLYGDVLKSYPTNSLYNHRYGVSLLESNMDIDLAEKHLKTSSSKGIRLSNYYLGKVYLKKYEFRRAVEYFEAYSRYLTPSNVMQPLVQQELERCKMGLELIAKTEKIDVLDTMIVPKSDFISYYNVSPETGSFLRTQLDGQAMADTLYVLFLTQQKDRCYYSKLNMELGTRDLIMRDKLLDKWSEEQLLSSFINTDKNEIFPFVSSDGMTMYFASEGHNGFGGYDIFVTRYNASTKSFLPPRTLGMPFNSPGNDLFYVIDETRNIGWFASDRHNKKGEITIYKFIPNSKTTIVSSEDPIALRKAALLKGFQFQRSDKVFITSDVAEQRMQDQTADGRVHFIVNDSTIYTSLADFKSPKAKLEYENYQGLLQKSDSISILMDEKRKIYNATSDEEDRKKIADEIVTLEGAHFSLKEEISNSEKEVRKLEWEVIHGELVNITDETAQPWEEPELQIKVPAVIVPTFYNKDLDNIYKDVFNLIEIKELQLAEEKTLEAHNLVLRWQETLQNLNVSNTASPQSVFSELIHRDTAFSKDPNKEELAKRARVQRNKSTVLYSEAYSMRYHTLLNKVQLDGEQIADPKVKRDVQRLIREAKFNFYDAGPLNNPKNSFGHYNFDQVTDALKKLERANDYLEQAILLTFKYKADNGLSKISAEAYDTLKKIGTKNNPENTKTIKAPERISSPKDTLPEIFYRVQIGLYRGKPKEDLVKKIPPVTFEVMEGQNLKRYYSGYYTDKQEAIAMAMEIDAIGFPGAFVVPFVNGKKSTWTEVKEYLNTK